MISVFQIFRILMGVIVFIFVITFFIRLSDTYSSTQEMGEKIEQVNAFAHSAMQVYTSGNPTTFGGFTDFYSLVYEAPRIQSDAGQHTLLVPAFFIPGKGEITLERRCLDFRWYEWCSVFAFPKSARILFTPLENTPESRALIQQVADEMPESMEFGFCNGTDARTTTIGEFSQYISGAAGNSYEPCRVNLPDHYRLVTISGTPGFSSRVKDNHVIINRAAGLAYEENLSGTLESRTYGDASDIVVFITGGVKALDYKNEVFSRELAAAASIMHERSILVAQKVKAHNVQPCQECSTPLPRACGWKDYRGNVHESDAYKDFISSLSSLKIALQTAGYSSELQDTAAKYAELENQGCE